MKTEIEKLKENANRQRAIEAMEEVGKHLEYLFLKIQKLTKSDFRYFLLEIGVWLTWLVTVLFGTPLLWSIVFILWIFIFTRRKYLIEMPLQKARGELEGFFKALEILGMLEESLDDKRERRRKKRKSFLKSLLPNFKDTLQRMREWRKKHGFSQA